MPAMAWSEGSPVKDCGFDSQSFTYWKAEGNADSLSFDKTTYGQNYLKIKGNASVFQNISGLVADETYTASVWVNVSGKKKATLILKNGNECIGQTSISESKVKNYTDNTDRYNTTWQRLKVPFRMPEGVNSIILSLKGEEADNDTSSVCFDDVRLVKSPCTLKEGYKYFEDFENVDEGWGPFIPCQPSAFTTHLSQKHGVYTDNTLNGEWSLATWRERNGEVYRTSPTFVRFEPGQTYEMSFDYLPNNSGVYQVAGKSLSAGETTFVYDLNRPGRCQIRFTTPSCDDFYIVIMKQGNGRLVIDDFGIKKIQ